MTYDDGIQIIDITNPSSPTPVLAISDDQDGYTVLNGAASITTTTIGSSTYALVASRDDSGVQIIDITDPTDPIAVSAATDNQNNFTRLAGAYSIATTTIDSSHYAIVVAPAGTDRGVQIINITNPNTPVAVSTFTSDNLIDAKSVTTTTLGSSTYAFVTSTYSDGVQILDITTPSAPTPVSHISDGAGGYAALGGAYSITTTTVGSSTYALVTSGSSASSATLAGQSGKSKVLTYDDGIQIIDITNPSSPTPVLAISDDQDGYTELNGAASITTTTIGSSTYALVASRDDSGVQIIDITDPTDPIAVSAATDNQNNFTRLAGAYSIATTTIDSSHYAIVVAPAGTDRGVQIINITNPNTPVAVSTFTSDNLIDAKSVTTTTLGSSTYAFVTSTYSDGVQILDITTPSAPTPVSHISDGAGGYAALGGAYSITTTTIDSSTYALVAARDDNDVQIMSLNPSMSFDNTNPNPEYAKAGDTLTFGFTTNNAIASDTPQFIIPPKNPSVTNGTRNDWVCSVCKYRMECASDKIYSRSNSIYKYACRKNILCYKQSYTLIVCKSYCKFGIIFYWVRGDS